jgi:hypothetical protein
MLSRINVQNNFRTYKCLVYLYNNVFTILKKLVKQFEMNLMDINYPKQFLKHYNQWFLLGKRFLKTLEKTLK